MRMCDNLGLKSYSKTDISLEFMKAKKMVRWKKKNHIPLPQELWVNW